MLQANEAIMPHAPHAQANEEKATKFLKMVFKLVIFFIIPAWNEEDTCIDHIYMLVRVAAHLIQKQTNCSSTQERHQQQMNQLMTHLKKRGRVIGAKYKYRIFW